MRAETGGRPRAGGTRTARNQSPCLTWGCTVAVRPGTRGNRAPGGLRPQQAVQALDVQGQTHQIPLALDRVQAAHPKLAKAQDALNPADGRFHQPCALGIRFLPLWGVQLGLHTPVGRGPGGGFPLPAQRHIAVDAAVFQFLQVPCMAVAGIGQQLGGLMAVVCLHRIQQAGQLTLVTGVGADRRVHNQLAVRVHHDLGVVAMRDWLPENHLVYTVRELVDQLDLAPFYAPYAQQGSGNLPYAPAMMVKILVYGYATGVLSSRRLAQKLEEDVAFRVLAAGHRPQHRTLCEIRRRHRADFGAVLVAVVQLARDLGLVSLATLVPDGTKVRAHARKRKAMSYGRMQQEEARLSAEIEKLQAAAEALDTAEDAHHGLDLRGDEVPVALQRRESRRAAIRAARAALEARAGAETLAEPPAASATEPPVTPKPKSQYNFTDPESRIMKTS